MVEPSVQIGTAIEMTIMMIGTTLAVDVDFKGLAKYADPMERHTSIAALPLNVMG
jgi:hypothetical protein